MRPPCLLSGPYPPVIGSIDGPPTKVPAPTKFPAVVPKIPTPAWPGAPAFTLPVGEVASTPFAWPASSLVGEPGGIDIPNPGGCISAPELPPPWIILLASYAWAEAPLPCENSGLQPLAASLANANTRWGPSLSGDAGWINLQTHASQKPTNSHLTSLSPFSRNTQNKQR